MAGLLLRIIQNDIDDYVRRHERNVLPYYGFGQHPYQITRSVNQDEVLANILRRCNDHQFSRKVKRDIPKIGKDGFQACIDVSQFRPSELSVKVIGGSVVIEGKHEEREDENGYISRHFIRRYVLPKGYDSEKVISTLSNDGVLSVNIPSPKNKKPNERIIQIQQTGPAHFNVKENIPEKLGGGDSSGKVNDVAA